MPTYIQLTDINISYVATLNFHDEKIVLKNMKSLLSINTWQQVMVCAMMF